MEQSTGSSMQGSSRVADREIYADAISTRLSRRFRTVAGIQGPSGATTAADMYLRVAKDGLHAMFDATSISFPHTVRENRQNALTPEGSNVRYTAIAAMGIACLPQHEQRLVLEGHLAVDLVDPVTRRALRGTDPGAVALATWLAAELGAEADAARGAQAIKDLVRTKAAIPTVDQAWMLTALVECGLTKDLETAAAELADRLIHHQASDGIFPHVLPPDGQSRLRAHVGCFADQVYPLQALARYATAAGDQRAIAAANRCADRICELQGAAGQWWWHYDARTSEIVEGYPVYSVHQHAMAPMALFDLYEAGGHDHRQAVMAGLAWINDHPEMNGTLVREDLGVIWRKIGRREPRKAMRSLRSVSTALRPGLRLSVLDRAFPPARIDGECRPYELGWLLYAWSRISPDKEVTAEVTDEHDHQ